jgi:glycosyltransferase involved in cell wall biosynthesis
MAVQTAERGHFDMLIVDSASAPSAAADLVELGAEYGARVLRVDRAGVSTARNTGAWAARTPYIAYIDDDAIPAPDWVDSILTALAAPGRRPAVIGGRILPRWETPLPHWWPPSLRGVLSIIEHEGEGEYRTPDLPQGLEPYAANMVVHVRTLLGIGGFGDSLGRYGSALLSDEEVQLAWKLQDAGHLVRFDSRIVVHHQIQAGRLNPDWLLRRLHWQGASTVLTRRTLNRPEAVWRELPRRLAVAALCAPAGLLPRRSPALIAARWRFAYATGFIRAALGWRASAAAARSVPPAVTERRDAA